MEYTVNQFIGLHTRNDRGQRPLGALDNVENLLFNKIIGAGCLRSGYTADLSGSKLDFSDQTTITSYRYARGTYPATETPSAQNITVLCGTDGSSGKHYFVRPFWYKNNATLESTEFLRLGESFSTTMSGKLTASFDLDDIPAWDAIDAYNGMIVHNTTRSEYLYITDSVSGNVTTLDDLPSDWANGDSITLYRYFHDLPTFSPSWTDPVTVKVGNNFIVSGGQGSTTGYKPIMFLPTINKTFFSGASRTPSYNQSYASELELKNDGSGISPQTAATYNATTSIDTNGGKRVFQYFVAETDDGLRGLPILAGTNYGDVGDSASSTDGLQTEVRINFARFDKRIRKLHHFAGVVDTSGGRTSLEWSEIFFIETFDLTSTGWVYNASGAAPGYYNRTIQLDGDKWTSRGEDLENFLGHTEPTRATVSFSYAEVANGRLFVAKYYDYVNAISFNDQVNFTPFSSGGVAQWNKLLDLDDQLQSSIQAGDPNVINAIKEFDGKLVVWKQRGSYYFDITADASTWILNTITKEIGCDAPDSVVVTPYGVIWAKSGDGIYLWRGGEPIELTANFRTDFIALTATYASSWWAWYDPATKGYRLMYTSDGSTKTTVYELHLNAWIPGPHGNVPMMTKHIMGHNVGQVTVRSDGAVFFSTGAAATYNFQSDDVDDAGTAIAPYFKLGTTVISENAIVVFQKFALYVTQSGSTSGQLDISPYVDGNVVGDFTSLTKTASRFTSELPDIDSDGHTRHGSTFDYAFNSNATRAALATGVGAAYTIHGLVIQYYLMARGGDLEQSL